MGHHCPPPRKRPCGESAGHSGSAPSPGASLRAANQAAGRGQRRPAGLRPTPNHRLFNGPSPKSDLQSANHTFHSTLGTTSKISAFRSFIYKITHEIIWLIVIGGSAGHLFSTNRDYNRPLINISELKCIPRVQPTS